MDPSFLQQFTASGLALGGLNAVSDSREAWKLLARIRERWLAECGWGHEWKCAVTHLVRAFSSIGEGPSLQPAQQEELEHFLR
eukprot:421582-Alexandrium_andersonii.AAC.1